jgi:chemotaxis protein methyltransferase CheR
LSNDTDTWEFEVKLLLEAIFFKYKSDFREYSPSSVRRRLGIVLPKLGLHTISQLQDRILQDPAAFDLVLQHLSVPTTEMFRDPAYFAALRTEVIPILATYPSLKIWCAGCSTGEEAFSLAILFEEERLLHRALIYATDINPSSLRNAQAGIIQMDELPKFTKNYQLAGGRAAFSDYYMASEKGAFLKPRLLDKIVFADHSLATDSVFGEMHLVSCRNVLIYFTRPLQNRAFGLFFDSLVPRGFLGIGSKEAIRFSDYAPRFDDFVPAQKIYRKGLPHAAA